MIQHVKHEAKTLIKFLVAGGASFLMYLGPYAFFTRVLFPEGNLVVLNLAATCISVIFNYFVQSVWTYRAPHHTPAQMMRYGFVVVSVTALQSLLFWTAVFKIGIHDIVASFFVAGICACYTFLMHRFFTFRPKPQA